MKYLRYFGAVFARSGLASKQGLLLANCIGVCDSYYYGEYIVVLHIVVMSYLDVKFIEVDKLTNTDKGDVVYLEYQCTINKTLKI